MKRFFIIIPFVLSVFTGICFGMEGEKTLTANCTKTPCIWDIAYVPERIIWLNTPANFKLLGEKEIKQLFGLLASLGTNTRKLSAGKDGKISYTVDLQNVVLGQ
jgi:hypothetical protein